MLLRLVMRTSVSSFVGSMMTGAKRPTPPPSSTSAVVGSSCLNYDAKAPFDTRRELAGSCGALIDEQSDSGFAES